MSEQTTQQTSTSFDLKVHDPTMLKEAVNIISEIVEEATFSIDEEGLHFRGMDPSHVCLADFRSPNADYEKWEVRQPGNFALRVDEFSKILKSLKKKESLSLSFNEDFILNVKSPSMSMNLKTIEISSTDCPLPKINYNSKVVVSGQELSRILKQIENVSDYVSIQTYNNRVIFSGKGDQGDVKIELEKGDPYLIELDVREESNSTYSLEYLLAFIKHTNKHTITLDFSTKQPIRLNAHLDQVTKIDYYLAPRVEN